MGNEGARVNQVRGDGGLHYTIVMGDLSSGWALLKAIPYPTPECVENYRGGWWVQVQPDS